MIESSAVGWHKPTPDPGLDEHQAHARPVGRIWLLLSVLLLSALAGGITAWLFVKILL